MTATASRQRQEVVELVGAYRAALQAAGMYAGHPVTSAARTWLTRVGVDGWSALSLAEQRATPLKDRRVVGWLMVTGRLQPSADYLVVGRPYLGEVASRHHPAFHAVFMATAAELGFDQRSARLQWSAVIKVAVLVGVAPDRLTKPDLDRGRDLLVAAVRRHHPDSHGVRARPPPCSAPRPPCSTLA
jgi:integrase/recombinase XerD